MNDEPVVLYMIDRLTKQWSREVLKHWEVNNMKQHTIHGNAVIERMFGKDIEEDLCWHPNSPVVKSMMKDSEHGLIVYKILT